MPNYFYSLKTPEYNAMYQQIFMLLLYVLSHTIKSYAMFSSTFLLKTKQVKGNSLPHLLICKMQTVNSYIFTTNFTSMLVLKFKCIQKSDCYHEDNKLHSKPLSKWIISFTLNLGNIVHTYTAVGNKYDEHSLEESLAIWIKNC